jgi:hypothetical protein
MSSRVGWATHQETPYEFEDNLERDLRHFHVCRLKKRRLNRHHIAAAEQNDGSVHTFSTESCGLNTIAVSVRAVGMLASKTSRSNDREVKAIKTHPLPATKLFSVEMTTAKEWQ